MKKQPLCAICQNRRSTIQVQIDRGNGLESHFLCNECAQQQQKNDLSNNPIGSFLGMFNQLLDGGNSSNENPSNKQPRRVSNGLRNSVLNNYCNDLTEAAELNQIDPIIGREKEIERVINILNRRTKNNPVLIGEPGVGKTAVAEGLALKISTGAVPEKLRHKRVLSLDIASITAGTMYRGMFEERMKKILKEVEKRNDVILFVDELHMIIGAGSSMDSNMDAANILKPYLARNKMQIIGATTLDEYREIEKDAALERRFQTVKVNEPSLEETIEILKGLRSHYEEFHGVRYSDEVIEACANIADRYVFERFMPDKAIDLMDEVGSRLNLKHNIQNESVRNRIHDLLEQERIAGNVGRYEEAIQCRTERLALLEKEQNDDTKYDVDVEEIKEIAESITGIPVTNLSDSDKKGLLTLEQDLNDVVIGQEKAVAEVARAVKRNRINLTQKKKPTVFFFAGPTGVGKTELTRRLAEVLFGDEQAMIRLDMSEYMEKHQVNKLIGSPPGYVGHEEPGQLTEKVRHRPYSVILLDEFEKAHHDVQNIFLQVFDDGRLTDGQGKTVDFSHSIIIMTSNIGSSMSKTTGFTKEEAQDRYLSAIQRAFKPEFINRIDSISAFESLTKEHILRIVDLMLATLQKGVEEKGIELVVSDEVKVWLADKGYSEKYGARPLQRVITRHIEDIISDYLYEHDHATRIVIDMDTETNEPCVQEKDRV